MLAQLGRGVRWTYLSMAIGALIQVAVTASTARLLTPEAFGLIAMANVVLRFGSYVSRMGVGRALVQSANLEDVDVRAGFTSATLLGVSVATVVAAAAPLAAVFYQNADVVPVLRWLSLTFVVSGMGATAGALLQRRLWFRASGVVEVLSYAVGYAVPTLVLASLGFGVWSLVAGTLGQVAVTGALAYALTRHPVRPSFDRAAHRRLLGFGATVSGISFLEFVGSTLDVLVIGRFGTAAQLGLYNRAYMLAALPSYRVANGITRVLFPVLSAGRGDRTAFDAAFLTIARAGIKLVIPLGIGMALAAPEMVAVVLGPQWLDATPLFAVLAFALSVDVLTMFPGLALDALGDLREKALVQVSYVIVLGTALITSAAIDFDLNTVTLIVGMATIVRLSAYFVLAYRARVITSRQLASLAAAAATASAITVAVMAPVLYALRTLDVGDLPTLVGAVAGGGVALAILFGPTVATWLRKRRSAP